MSKKDGCCDKTDTHQHTNDNKQSSQTKPKTKTKLEYYTQYKDNTSNEHNFDKTQVKFLAFTGRVNYLITF